MNSDADVRPPRELTPAFYGCYDWHSAVHGHWLLVRLTRLFPEESYCTEARNALSKSFTPQNIAGEVQYLQGSGRETFERPYGLAWFLQLAAELFEWKDTQAQQWSTILTPLVSVTADRIKKWLPKLSHPIRSGEHSQTAFAFGLILDWARTVHDVEMEQLLISRIQNLYGMDQNCPQAYEPSGQDFLSPCLAEADLMRRVLDANRFASWLQAFLPMIPHDGSANWLPPCAVIDPADGKLAHLDGLNLSRAWMLEGIAGGLPSHDSRLSTLQTTANIHSELGIRSISEQHYEGAHWLGTFAVYLITKRGMD